MKCGLYGLYFDDVRDQVRWLPAPCVLGIYIYKKKKIYCYFGLGKAGLLHRRSCRIWNHQSKDGLASILHMLAVWNFSGLFFLGKFTFGWIFFPSGKLWWGISLVFAETFYGLETLEEAPQLWLPGRLFVCLRQKVALVSLISELATEVSLARNYGIFT
jgi:hypothetical protein